MVESLKALPGMRGLTVNRPTATCELTGKVVSIWSEQWRYACEFRTILAMSKSDRDAYFDGGFFNVAIELQTFARIFEIA